MNFLAELKRRHMYRVAAAYAVIAWVLLQIVNNLAPALKLPDWVATAIVVLLAVGFPVALLFCWIQHLAPADGAGEPAKTNRLDWLLAGGLAAVIVIFLVQEFSVNRATTLAEPIKVAAGSPAGSISLAVLPFVNLSSDKEQEFFSDGMTEEITSALAKVPNLRVVGRTSAFQFKGENRDLRTIGQALSATHLIEGSVRKDGNEVRITAQLIKADDGTHLWTESYNRELKGVFALQDDIAQAIAAALQVPLGLKQGETLVSNRNIDLDGYQKFLRARQIINAVRTRPATADAISLLQQVLLRNPEYAPAWAWLASAYDLAVSRDVYTLSGAPEETRLAVEQSFAIEEAAAQRALQLDPNLPIGIWSAGLIQVRRGKLVAAEQLYLKALARDPNEPQILQYYSSLLAGAGRLKEALAMKRKAQAVEPLVPLYNWMTARVLWLAGNTDDALALGRDLSYDGAVLRAQIYASAGRYGDAADALATIPPNNYLPGVVETAVKLLCTAPKANASLQNLPRLGYLAFAYLYAGAPERALEFFEVQAQTGDLIPILYSDVWHPSYAPVRKTERFKQFTRDAGLVDYWKARGWPDLCHPTTGDDFECN